MTLTFIHDIGTLAIVLNLKKNTKLVFMIPGNPGIIQYYEEFLNRLSFSLGHDYSIVGLQHLGHSNIASQSKHIYSLQDQINHKQECLDYFIGTLKPKKVYILGHSVGGYISLHVIFILIIDEKSFDSKENSIISYRL